MKLEEINMKYDKLALFAGGVVFGTAGIAILASREAKKLYTCCTAAVLRGKDAVMDCYETLKENCEDIVADAQDMNEIRYAEDAAMELEEARAVIAQYEEDMAEAQKCEACEDEEEA